MSDAGTSLKTMLLNLIPQTDKEAKLFDKLGVTVKGSSNAFFDAHGNIKSMSEIAQILQDKLKDLTNEQRQATLAQMFGSDAIRAGNILYKEGAKGLNDMTTAMMKIKAADVAAVKMDTLKGAFKEFQATLQNVGITLGEEFLPLFTDIVKNSTEFVRGFGNVDMTAVKVGLAMAGTATAVALVGSSIAKLSVALRAFALTPAGAAITALSILGGVIAGAVVQSNEMNKVTLENANAMIKQHDTLQENINSYDQLREKSKLSTEELGRFVDINSEISKTADPNVIARLKDEQEKLRIKSGLSVEELNKLVDVNKQIIDTVPGASLKITEQGNALLNNSDAAKKYNAEQLKSLQLELERQQAIAESKLKENLATELSLKKQINSLNTEHETLLGNINKKQSEINHAEDGLAKAKAAHNEASIQYWNDEILRANQELQILQKHNGEMIGKIQKKQTSLEKTQEEIGKLDEVKRKMVDIQLQQAGINAKRGEEVSTLNTAISKLEAQKKALQDATPINMRNTQEYKEGVSAIQSQIDKLQGTKSKIGEIIGKAAAMNDALGSDVTKNVNVFYREQNKFGRQQQYHTGGIIGRGQLPQLHVGGLASQFANNAPNHNEIDVRLLRNEAVLTESQQANLMRMIDAGVTGGTNAGTDFSQLINAIQAVSDRPINLSVEVDGEQIASAAYPHIDRRNSSELSTKFLMNGMKR